MMDTSTVYVGLILSLCLLGYGLFSRIHRGGADGPVCPCSDPKYCERIKDTTRKEVRTEGVGYQIRPLPQEKLSSGSGNPSLL